MQLNYNKGRPCLYKAILCQEGHCSGCYIYLEKSQFDLFSSSVRLNSIESSAQSTAHHIPEYINVT